MIIEPLKDGTTNYSASPGRSLCTNYGLAIGGYYYDFAGMCFCKKCDSPVSWTGGGMHPHERPVPE